MKTKNEWVNKNISLLFICIVAGLVIGYGVRNRYIYNRDLRRAYESQQSIPGLTLEETLKHFETSGYECETTVEKYFIMSECISDGNTGSSEIDIYTKKEGGIFSIQISIYTSSFEDEDQALGQIIELGKVALTSDDIPEYVSWMNEYTRQGERRTKTFGETYFDYAKTSKRILLYIGDPTRN